MLKITVKQAAKLMGKSMQFIRCGIKSGTLPIGTYVDCKEDNSRSNYFISPYRLAEVVGCSLEDLKEELKC